MTNDDRRVVSELMSSVYLTGRQKQALGRLMAAAKVEPARPFYTRTTDEVTKTLEEDRRHALLGPCGAE